MTFDGAAARARIEALPWIETASISRVYPGSLDIRVTERKAAALWMKGERANLIDAGGRVLSGVKPGTPVNLPRVAGKGRPQQAKALLDLVMRYPSIWERFELAERVGERRWTLHLKDRVTIHLAADREAVALRGARVCRRPRRAAFRPRPHHRFAHARDVSPCAAHDANPPPQS